MTTLLNNTGRLVSDEFKIAVAMDKIDGWEVSRKFGMNKAVNGSGTTEDCWPPGTVRVLPTTAAVAAVSSSSTDDDAAPAGTGAWTVRVSGLDENLLEVSEDVTLNGTSAVNTTQTFLRINRAFVLTAGSNETNVGDISASVGGNLQAFIDSNEGQTQQAMLTVPADKYLVIDLYAVGVGRMAGSSDAVVYGQIKTADADASTVVPPGTDARVQITSTAATQMDAIIAGYLVETRAWNS